MASPTPPTANGLPRKRGSDTNKVYSRKSHPKKPKLPPPPLAAVDVPASSLNISTPLPVVKFPIPVDSPSARRSLRRKLDAELHQVRSLSLKLEAHPHDTQPKRTPKANNYYAHPDFIKSPVINHHKLKYNGSGNKHKSKHVSNVDESVMYAQAFRSCGVLLNKLMKHKFGWVFNCPVDVKGLGLHDYGTIVKKPMDLGTVKSRVSNNWYKFPGEFAEDVRLTFNNAMLYNGKGEDVFAMAEQLLQMFEEGWTGIEAEFNYLNEPLAQMAKKTVPVDVRKLERSGSTVHTMAVEGKAKPVTHVGRTPGKKPKASEPNKRDMTFEEKQKLSNSLQELPSEKLDNVVQIIKKRNKMTAQNENEIEVDIDNVEVETLWELDRFLTNYRKSLSKNRKKAELAIQATGETEQSATEKAPESVQESVSTVPTVVHKESNEVMEEEKLVSSSLAGEQKVDNAPKLSNSSSSSTGSGSSSTESGSEGSSARGSDAAHSPKT